MKLYMYLKCSAIVIMLFAPFMPLLQHADSRGAPQLWRAHEVVDKSDIIILTDRGHQLLGRLNIEYPRLFGAPGRARLQQVKVQEVVCGEHDDMEGMIVIAEPPGMHSVRMPRINRSGEYLLFLRQMSTDEVSILRESVLRKGIAEQIPDEVWAFTHSIGDRWMSVISFSFIDAEGEVVDIRYDIIRSQLERVAGVPRDKRSVVAYVKELVSLHEAVVRGDPIPPDEKRDPFQRAVAGEELERPRPPRERMPADPEDPW